MKDVNWMEKVGLLPALPKVAMEVIQKMKDDNIGIVEIVKIIEKDAVLSAKILKLANSAAYANPNEMSKVMSVKNAAQKLGLGALRNIIMASAVSSMHKKVEGLDMEKFTMFALLTAENAKVITKTINQEGGLSEDEAFTVGLLLSIGILVMRMTRPDIIKYIDDSVGQFNSKRTSIEKKVLNISYEEISQELAKKWGLPQEMIEAFCGSKKVAMITKLASMMALKSLHEEGEKDVLNKNFEDFGIIEKSIKFLGIEGVEFIKVETIRSKYRELVSQ